MRRGFFDEGLEPERYELFERHPWSGRITRRRALEALGGGIAVFLAITGLPAQEARRGRRGGGGRGSVPAEIGAWLHIGEDGAVTVFSGKVEVGQGIRTSLAQAVADELRVPLESVRLVLADTARVPFDGGTSGSRTTPGMAPQLRRAAAAAREMLLDLAAESLQAERAALRVAAGRVEDPATGRSRGFGELAKGKRLERTIADDICTTPASDWQVASKPAARAGGRDLVTGKHRYASDQRLPGMLHAKVLRPPSFGASLVSLDAKDAEAVEGARVVRDGDLVAAIAPREDLAARALAALRAEWKESPGPAASELFAILKAGSGGDGGRDGRPADARGSLEEGLAAAEVKLESTYTVAYIAHAPLETRAALAEWKDGGLTVWTGTQRPFGVRSDLAEALGVDPEKVRVIVPDTGAGFGGKHTGDAALEAARLARAAGAPVKVVWSREEELTWAYFRPAGVIEVRSGARRDGALTAWEFHNYNSGASAIRTPYDVPNQRVELHGARSPLRQGSYRALASTANCFARESHMDEVAAAVSLDPLELRRRNLKDARLLAVLEAAQERFGWKAAREGTAGSRAAAGEGRRRGAGLACGTEKGSFVATCAEVSCEKDGRGVKVERLVTAFECGAIVDPAGLESQVEGAVIQGLGGALFEAVDFAGGKVLNARFSRYRVPRFSDVPRLETVLLDRKDLPSAGAGETPIIGVAPAIANAVFDASGVRKRSMPLDP
ncbi:MAG: xanthine dehydrogenase family protein molybdopterin-binding subunit [Planctomycetes bacterium]|nr:xanthine dehydrogenase family protein molybdopterin-binding subunit [Planctomycetota bacterium]